MADQTQIRHLLDSPDVPADTKKDLVRALYSMDPRGEDVARYASANGVELPGGFGALDGAAALVSGGLSVPFSIQHDGEELTRFLVPRKDIDGLVTRASRQADFGRSGRALQDTGDVAGSDQLLDDGVPGLRFFDTFLPVYPAAAQAAGFAGPPAPDLQGGIYRRYDEMRGIDFGAFRADAHRIDDAAAKAATAKDAMSHSFASLTSSWQGPAAEAAAEYHIGFFADGDQVVQQTKSAAGPILAGVTDIQAKVRLFAQRVHGLAGDTCANQTVEVVKDNIRKAGGQVEISDLGAGDDWLHAAGTGVRDAFLTGFLGPVGTIIGANDAIDVGRQMRDTVMKKATADLRSFCAAFTAQHNTFANYCDTVQADVRSSYNRMLGALRSGSHNPFGRLGAAPVLTGNGGQPGEGKPGERHQPGPAGHQPGPAGHQPGGGGDPPGAGQPVAGAPVPGAPVPGAPQTVTIQSDDGPTITATSPDGTGRVKLSVDTGHGPKSYDLDFAKGSAAPSAAFVDAVPGMPTGSSGERTPPPGSGSPSAGRPGSGSPGPAGATGPGGDPAAPPRPVGDGNLTGHDGKLTVHDGSVTITAEQVPGHPGELTITVDTGRGSPTTYTLDFDDDDKGEVTTSADVDAGTDAGAPGPAADPSGAGGDDRDNDPQRWQVPTVLVEDRGDECSVNRLRSVLGENS